uniref:Uncharacterized protein n=1 Tax=Oryza nivara TaxID=4536 RepID=A0A0E0GY87_ORYNI
MAAAQLGNGGSTAAPREEETTAAARGGGDGGDGSARGGGDGGGGSVRGRSGGAAALREEEATAVTRWGDSGGSVLRRWLAAAPHEDGSEVAWHGLEMTVTSGPRGDDEFLTSMSVGFDVHVTTYTDRGLGVVLDP